VVYGYFSEHSCPSFYDTPPLEAHVLPDEKRDCDKDQSDAKFGGISVWRVLDHGTLYATFVLGDSEDRFVSTIENFEMVHKLARHRSSMVVASYCQERSMEVIDRT
jgi:hypothetical protein